MQEHPYENQFTIKQSFTDTIYVPLLTKQGLKIKYLEELSHSNHQEK